MDRTFFNAIGALILFLAVFVGCLIYVECIHPQEMAKLGWVQVEGGRYVPANSDSNDPRVDVLAKQTQDVIVKLQRQINDLKKTKKDK